jgi:hypothetical protein
MGEKMNNLYNIKVGDTLESVIKKLGEPTSKMIVNYSLLLYMYKGDMWKAHIYILNDKVEAIYKEERE